LFSIIAILIFGATVVQVYKLENKRSALQAELSKIEKKVNELAAENSSLEKDIAYFQNPKNLEKEARAQFNYALPDEKLIILVPEK
jgi:cell division protein FtsB